MDLKEIGLESVNLVYEAQVIVQWRVNVSKLKAF
jgi:hypothetical protein